MYRRGKFQIMMRKNHPIFMRKETEISEREQESKAMWARSRQKHPKSGSRVGSEE